MTLGKNPLLTSVLILIVCVALLAQFVFPWYDEIALKREHIASLLDTFTKGANRLDLRNELSQQYRQINQEQLEIVSTAVPAYTLENIGLFFLSLNELLRKSPIPQNEGYVIQEEVLDDSTLVIVPVRFNFTEINYSGLITFLENIENWDRSVKITSLEISQPANNPGSSSNVRASVEMHALFHK